MKLKRLCSLLTAAVMLLCSGSRLPECPVQAAETILYKDLQGMPFADGAPFKGVDVSSIIALEESGVKFYDRGGREQDIFLTLADAGVNSVRIRIWNDPKTASGETYGGGANDVAQAEKIAARCAKAGLKLLVDFHYSDFWADPQKQAAPKAWKHLNVEQKASAIYDFTKETLQRLSKTGAEIAMVQIGNETTTGMCGVFLKDGDWDDDIWRQLASLWNAGAKAVREFDSHTLVALHFTNPEKASNMAYLAKQLQGMRVDYDVFATSYYPYWHGTLDNLKSVLTNIATTYHKKVMVAETSWAYTFDNMDGGSNTISDRDGLGNYVNYPVSVEGQHAFLSDLFRTVASVPDGIGVFYWEPAWLGVSSDYDTALNLWNRYGGGWATKAAEEYDADAKWYGGSAVDNQALFDAQGHPLDSLYVYQTVRGNGHGGGNHEDKENLLFNSGFEADGGWTDQPSGWQLYSAVKDSGGHFDVRAEDTHSGGYAVHWYTEEGFTHSVLRAAVTAPKDGMYEISMFMQGNEESSYIMAACARRGTLQREPDSHSEFGDGWNRWNEPKLHIAAMEGDEIELLVTVDALAGGYGSLDDVKIVWYGELPDVETTTTTEMTTTTTTTTTTRTESTTAPQQYVWGDVDCDGTCTVSDAVLASRIVVQDKAVVVSEAGMRNADCNHDERLNDEDVTLMILYLARRIAPM